MWFKPLFLSFSLFQVARNYFSGPRRPSWEILADALEEYLVRHRIDPEPSFSGHDLQSGGAVEGNDSGDGAPPRRRARLADAIEEYVARQRNDPESSGSGNEGSGEGGRQHRCWRRHLNLMMLLITCANRKYVCKSNKN